MLNTTSHHAAVAAALAVAATAALAAGAGAQPTAATRAARVMGAYLYIQKLDYSGAQHASKQPFATLVFKTDRQLPRRFDGLIRAGAGVAGQNGSVGSVAGKASRCYSVNARIKPDNTITGTSSAGKRIETMARAGSRLRVQITTAKGAPTLTRTLTLHTARPGDASGRPLSC